MDNKKSILLTGGTGLIGSALTKQLLNKGYTVSHLSRKPVDNQTVKTFFWDVASGEIDPHCIEGVDTIVHLAGAGIAEKRWTKERKKELIESRTRSIALIYDLIKKQPNQVKNVVSAAATGYYGDRVDELLTETSAPGFDFLSTCCIDWEHAVDVGESLSLRIIKFRTGVVLDKNGGALPQLAAPVKFAAGSPLGTGKQWIPWIHHQDVIDIYLMGIENEALNGVFNMVAPNPVTNKQMTKALAKQLHRPLWLPNVPAFALKLLLGEMAEVVLGSDKVSSKKIEDAGFIFKYPEIGCALKEIYG
jgi:uncharacterized protein (TIGR01777 family)